jgi:hypothetical protein
VGKGSCDGRLFEATEIATMDDKMLMEKTLDNLGRTVNPRNQIVILHSGQFRMQNAEFQTNSFRRLRNCPTREEFRTVESIPSDPISQNISTYKILTLTLPCI